MVWLVNRIKLSIMKKIFEKVLEYIFQWISKSICVVLYEDVMSHDLTSNIAQEKVL